MGEHKLNPTAIKAKNGELPPKPKPMSKRESEVLIRKKIEEATGLPKMIDYVKGFCCYGEKKEGVADV